MRSASYQQSSYTQQAPFRRRAIAFSLALLTNGLIVFMLLRLAISPDRRTEKETQLITVHLQPEAVARVKAPTRIKRPSGGARPRPPAPAAAAPPVPLQMVIVSREVFAASDIARMPSHRDERPANNGTAGTGGGSGSASGPGEGPGGEQLYDADWYRKPTHAELAYYLPPGTQTGWGMIACQTIDQYRVDNCREIGDSPPGSGLARAVRQAAWQFRVRPPRIGGRVLVGAWVRIKIDITPDGKETADR